METGVATTAGADGSIASVGHSLANVGQSLAGVGTASKAFVLVHPVGLAAAGGVVLGMGAYYAIGKMLKKKEVTAEPEATTA